jgi:hypothetical protein
MSREKLSDTLIRGDMIGARGYDRNAFGYAIVIVTKSDETPEGPASNAFVIIDYNYDPPRARYISWINLFDIEYAARFDSRWRTVEPSEAACERVRWLPYGWSGEALPSVAR